MNGTLRRYRYVLGVPSLLLVLAALIVNTFAQVALDAIGPLYGQILWLASLCALAVFLAWRWDHKRTQALAVGQPATDKLAHRRAAVVLVGLDSCDPDGSLAKLLGQLENLEFLALVGTPQTAELGVPERILHQLLPATGVHLPPSAVRIWQHCNAQSLADNDQSVAEAISWILRQGVPRDAIVVDISRGRRAMGYGALMAAEAERVEVQYLATAWDHIANAPIPNQEAFKLLKEYYPDAVDTDDRSSADVRL